MKKVEPRTLAGFMELLPNEQILFNQMKEKIEKTYKKFGFLPLDNRYTYSRSITCKSWRRNRKTNLSFPKRGYRFSITF